MKAYYAAFVPEGGKFSVLFPDVPGCATWGESVGEAFERAIEALAGHLEALETDGDPIPEAGDYTAAWAKTRAEYASFDIGPLPEATQLLLVPAPDLAASPGEIRLSFQPQALDMIDRKAAAAGMTRSGFLARAAEAYQVEAH